MKSVEPRTDRTRTSLGLSFMNLSVRNEGGFAEGRGGWLLTARRGFMDIVFNIANVDGDFHPAYYDVFGKVNYELKPGHRLSAQLLHAGDDLRGADDDDKSRHKDLYGSSYLWVTWDAELAECPLQPDHPFRQSDLQGPARPGLRRGGRRQDPGCEGPAGNPVPGPEVRLDL